jgi:hypothetical protein
VSDRRLASSRSDVASLPEIAEHERDGSEPE